MVEKKKDVTTEERNALPFDEIQLNENEMLVVYGGTGMSYFTLVEETSGGIGCGCGCGCGC